MVFISRFDCTSLCLSAGYKSITHWQVGSLQRQVAFFYLYNVKIEGIFTRKDKCICKDRGGGGKGFYLYVVFSPGFDFIPIKIFSMVLVYDDLGHSHLIFRFVFPPIVH